MSVATHHVSSRIPICPPAPRKRTIFMVDRHVSNYVPRRLFEVEKVEIYLNYSEWTRNGFDVGKWHHVQACCEHCQNPTNPFRDLCKRSHHQSLKRLITLTNGITANDVLSCLCVKDYAFDQFKQQLRDLGISYEIIGVNR